MHPQRTCANRGLPEEVTVRNSLFFAFDKYVAQMVCPESGQLNVTSRRINLVHEGRPPLRGSFRVMRTLRAACLKLSSTWSMSSFSESGLSVPSDVCGPVVDSVYSSHSFSMTLYPVWTMAKTGQGNSACAGCTAVSYVSFPQARNDTDTMPPIYPWFYIFVHGTGHFYHWTAFLRSGTSPVWRHLPSDWDASETDLVRAMLILTRLVREAMLANGALSFALLWKGPRPGERECHVRPLCRWVLFQWIQVGRLRSRSLASKVNFNGPVELPRLKIGPADQIS